MFFIANLLVNYTQGNDYVSEDDLEESQEDGLEEEQQTLDKRITVQKTKVITEYFRDSFERDSDSQNLSTGADYSEVEPWNAEFCPNRERVEEMIAQQEVNTNSY